MSNILPVISESFPFGDKCAIKRWYRMWSKEHPGQVNPLDDLERRLAFVVANIADRKEEAYWLGAGASYKPPSEDRLLDEERLSLMNAIRFCVEADPTAPTTLAPG
jgi:hypothetical protein